MVPRRFGRLLRRLPPLVLYCSAPLGPAFAGHGSSSVGAAPIWIAPLRSGRRSPDMVPRHFGRLLRRLPQLVCIAPLRSGRRSPDMVSRLLVRLRFGLPRSARAGVRRTWSLVDLVASSVGSPARRSRLGLFLSHVGRRLLGLVVGVTCVGCEEIFGRPWLRVRCAEMLEIRSSSADLAVS